MNVKNDTEIREDLIARLYVLLRLVLLFGIGFILIFTVIKPVENNFGTMSALGCFFLIIAIWYLIPIFSYEKFMWVKESSFSILFILLSIFAFLDYINKVTIGTAIALSIVINIIGRIIVKRFDNGIYLNRRY